MSTRLESMIVYLAGRDGEGVPALRAELDDPASEASRFLDAVRIRSRSMLDDAFAPSPPKAARRRAVPRRVAAAAALAASVLLAAVGVLGFGEARLRRLEATLARGEAESRAHADRLERALARAIEAPRPVAVVEAPAPPSPPLKPDPVETALGRVEAGIGRLATRFDNLDRPAAPPGPALEPEPATPDPAIAEIRRDLASLRRELVASDQAGARQVMEIRIGLQEVNNLLRMALNRHPMPPVNVNPNFPNAQPGAIPQQVMGLVANLSSPHAAARLEAVEQLARMGQAAQAALPALQQMLHREPDHRVRTAVQAAIAAIGSM